MLILCSFKAPLVILNKESEPMTATLIGIVSWGAGCGYVEHPDIYGRVTHVLNWIELNTGNRNTKSS